MDQRQEIGFYFLKTTREKMFLFPWVVCSGQTLQSQELLQWETKPVLISFGGRYRR